ncbi:hypothetical protein DL767_005973 [Monosporascus sp. MG133]|nr:hypothetical protein DL767_005973 [Monosporascus sp. MG133]
MADETKTTTTSYSTDPALYLYTSLTAGSSHIVTATSRLETILRANRVPFKAIDIAVDEKARMLWGRRAGKDANGRMRKLPGLVQMGLVLGDLVEIEEWNEYGEVRQHVSIYHDDFTIPTKAEAEKMPNKLGGTRGMLPTAAAEKPAESSVPSTAGAAAQPPAAPPLPENTKPAASSSSSGEGPKKSAASATAPIRSVAEEAAQKAKQLRLESLREKVYGSKKGSGDAAATKDAKEDTTATTAEDNDKAATTTAAASTKEEGASASAVSVDSAAVGVSELTISPTATRRSEDGGAAEGVKKHRGSTVADAPAEEIKAVEQAQAIPEAPAEEDGKAEGAEK